MTQSGHEPGRNPAPKGKPPPPEATRGGVLLDFCFRGRSNKQCEQFNYTNSDNQHCECYGIVVQPIQLLLHGNASLFQIPVKRQGRRDNASSRLAFPVHKRKAPDRRQAAQSGSARRKTPPLGESCDGVPGPIEFRGSVGAAGATLPVVSCSEMAAQSSSSLYSSTRGVAHTGIACRAQSLERCGRT
jgi:hypothetical protein